MTAFTALTSAERTENAKRAWEKMNARKFSVDSDAVTFGIEIECLVPVEAVRRLGIVPGPYHHGYPLPAPFPSGWNCQHDGSVRPLVAAELNLNAVEIVSPVLSGLDGFHQVEQVARLLTDNGARANASCGCHVHIGVRSLLGERSGDLDLVSEFVRRLLNLVSIHEFALAAITGSRARLNNQYCQSVKSPWSGKLKAGDKYDKFNEECRGVNRYHTLNLNNLFDTKRTLEFRIFGGTVNANKMHSYIVTAIGLCQKAAESAIVPAFDSKLTLPTDWMTEVRKLQNTLKLNSQNAYGFPTGAWNEYHAAIIKNQKWNVEHFITNVEAN